MDIRDHIHVSILKYYGIHCDHIRDHTRVSILWYYDVRGGHIHVSILWYYGIHCIIFMFQSYSTMAFTVSILCLYPIVRLHSLRPIHGSSLGYYGIHCEHIHVSLL